MFKHPKISEFLSRLSGRSSPGTTDSADRDGMTTIQQAEALASGENTETSVETTLRMADHGKVTIAHGTVKATAAAEPAEGGAAFADAETDVSIEGADIVFIFGVEGSGGSGGSTYDQSIKMFRAVDIEHWNGPSKIIDFGQWNYNLHFPRNIDGNVAKAEIDAQVSGEDTFIEADAFALAVEDELSLSTMVVTSAVG